MTSAIHLGIVADDLTGANDTAVQFGTRGWDARIALSMDVPLTGAVVAVSTDARALDGTAAAAATAEAVQRLNPSRLYLKIDSTARGSIAAQVRGAMSAWSTRHPGAVAVVCPAYPAMGRTVEDGEVRVGGVPVDRTSIGSDPVTPVTEASLVARIPNARRGSVDDVATAEPGAVFVLDARSPAQLDQLVLRLAPLGERVILVGSAGLAESLARHLPGERAEAPAPTLEGPAVVLVSSLNPVSHDQLRVLRDEMGEAVRVYQPAVAELQMNAAGDANLTPPAPPSAAEARVEVIQTPSSRLAEGDGGAAARIADALAQRVSALVGARRPASLGLVGGDGARAVLRRLGATALAVRGSTIEGAPLMSIVGGPHDGLATWTKAGGFGDPRALVTILTLTGALAPARFPTEDPR